jgi:hypothetical protein
MRAETTTPAGASARTAAAPLAQWYDAAGVRTGIRRVFADETEAGKVFFPDHLVPYLSHEAVAALPPERRREVTVRHLYQFLMSTTHLETRVVNPAAERIANGRAGVDVPFGVRQDAFKIYCDEGYHALYSLDIAEQIAVSTAITVPDVAYDGFVVGLERAAARLLPGLPVLAELLRAVVFETLITSVLNELPNDLTVITTIRDLMRDHARDEGHHHRFFSAFFQDLWQGLDSPVRAQVALALPAFIRECLRWDTGPIASSLTLAGLDRATAKSIVDEVYADDVAAIRGVTRATVRLCEATGVFDVAGATEAFAAQGLEPTR